jgi:hypothetical protein
MRHSLIEAKVEAARVGAYLPAAMGRRWVYWIITESRPASQVVGPVLDPRAG